MLPPPRYALGPMNPHPGLERPRPMLGQQPPLPGDEQVAIRIVQHDNAIEEQALVPMQPYSDGEQYDYDSNLMMRDSYDQESNYSSSYNSQMRMGNVHQNDGLTLSQGTLMFIANQGEPRQHAYP